MNDPVNYVDLWGLYITESDMSELDDGNSGLQKKDNPVVVEKPSGPLWGQIGEGVATTIAGVAGAVGSIKIIAVSGGSMAEAAGSALLGSIQITGYGITQIVKGFTGHEQPSVLDFLKEILSSGFANTDFDKKGD